MKISTEIASASRITGEEKAIEYYAKAGFDAWDFSMFDMCRYDHTKRAPIEKPHPLNSSEYLKFARKLKQIGLDNGIKCNQSHAPFPSSDPTVRSYLKRAIECTAEAGGEICVIHPCNADGPEKNAEMYMENYVSLPENSFWNLQKAVMLKLQQKICGSGIKIKTRLPLRRVLLQKALTDILMQLTTIIS